MCGISTGSGQGGRAFYTNTDEVVYKFMRPILLNGIDDLATSQDLINRSIVINLQPIADKDRRTEEELWSEFNKDKPAIEGVLLTRLSLSMRQYDTIEEPNLPRMADFVQRSMAAMLPGQQQDFLDTYLANRKSAVESGLEGSAVAIALREMVTEAKPFNDTAAGLLVELNAHVPEEVRIQRSWPKNPRSLSVHLRRLAPGLRTIGIFVGFPASHNAAKKIRIIASVASAASDKYKNQVVTQDARQDAKQEQDAKQNQGEKQHVEQDANRTQAGRKQGAKTGGSCAKSLFCKQTRRKKRKGRKSTQLPCRR
ncbi:MAG TPA: hypothetical protein VKB96_14465 [Gammaproteobacteria bacterium]|nr:hypothetical protein [Gammaproteobacteria bacterium]